jgi:poly(3-hydroxybutyrate) depolymerase
VESACTFTGLSASTAALRNATTALAAWARSPLKIAGYVRKPAGAGPFPLVIVLHGGGPTAKAVKADTAEERLKKEVEEAVRASKVLGKAGPQGA